IPAVRFSIQADPRATHHRSVAWNAPMEILSAIRCPLAHSKPPALRKPMPLLTVMLVSKPAFFCYASLGSQLVRVLVMRIPRCSSLRVERSCTTRGISLGVHYRQDLQLPLLEKMRISF